LQVARKIAPCNMAFTGNVFICQTHVLHQYKYTALTFHIFGSFNATKTKIPRSIQCNNMSPFIAIVLVDVNIIAIYEL
jgi:hypothetical protein